MDGHDHGELDVVKCPFATGAQDIDLICEASSGNHLGTEEIAHLAADENLGAFIPRDVGGIGITGWEVDESVTGAGPWSAYIVFWVPRWSLCMLVSSTTSMSCAASKGWSKPVLPAS